MMRPIRSSGFVTRIAGVAGVACVACASGSGSAPRSGAPVRASGQRDGLEVPAGCSVEDPCALAAGTYVTEQGGFLPGLRFSVPAGWSSTSTSVGELELHPTDTPGKGGAEWPYREVLLFSDAVLYDDGRRVSELGTPPESLVRILASNRRFTVSPAVGHTIGSIAAPGVKARRPLPFLTVTVAISPTATADAGDCPPEAVCVDLLRIERFDNPYTLTRNFPDAMLPARGRLATRVSFASIGTPRHPRTLTIALSTYAVDPEPELAALERQAAPILDSLVVPHPADE